MDLFNEGVDLPAIDTVLMLRPTESATIFLQQLGRGLRRFDGKDVLTVLDFVGHQAKEFRFDLRYRRMLGRSRTELVDDIEQDFPYLPAGSRLQLDRVAREIVLDNIRTRCRPPGRTGKPSCANSVMSHSVSTCTRRASSSKRSTGATAHGPSSPRSRDRRNRSMDDEARLGRGIARLLHVDDQERIERTAARGAGRPPSEGICRSETGGSSRAFCSR